MNTEALKHYIITNARTVERTMFEYFFEHGPKEAVVDELLAYQNPDGGFGHGLEADYWNPASSPIATNDAIIRLYRVDALDPSAKIVKDVICYLKSGDSFDKKEKKWLFAIESNRDYPHAIWWEKQPDSNGISYYNPTVSLAAFLACFNADDDGFYAAIVREAFQWLETAEEVGSDGMKCFLLAYGMMKRFDVSNIVDFEMCKVLLQRCIRNEISTEVSKYGKEYVTTPSDFFTEDNWCFLTPEAWAMICEELKVLPGLQMDDGGFDIFWKWYTPYTEFEAARNMWRPKVSLEKLLFWTAAYDETFRRSV